MDVTTALTIVMPLEHHEKINYIRAVYDRAFPRWMPHINLIFPFVPAEEFPKVTQILKDSLSEFQPFEIELNEIGCFSKKGVSTVHLKTSNTETIKKLQELFDIVTKALLSNNIAISLKHVEFKPHMTLAQFKNKEYEDKRDDLNNWLQKEFNGNLKITIDHICILQRTPTSPFIVNTRIYF